MIGIAVIPAIAFFVGMLGLPDTPRWYARKGRLERCRQTLARAHPAAEAEVEYRQMLEITQRENTEAKSVRTALRALAGHVWMRRLLWVGIVLAVAQQITGINVVMCSSPLAPGTCAAVRGCRSTRSRRSPSLTGFPRSAHLRRHPPLFAALEQEKTATAGA